MKPRRTPLDKLTYLLTEYLKNQTQCPINLIKKALQMEEKARRLKQKAQKYRYQAFIIQKNKKILQKM